VGTGPGAVYVVGETIGTLPLQTNQGARDGFVRKYDVLGNEQWTRQFGTSVQDSPRGVAADASGVYVVGSTDGTLGQSSAGTTDAFVRKYDVNGSEQWTRQFGASNVDEALAIASDGTSIYVVGNIELGALTGQTALGGGDAFLRKYDANGNEQWTRQFGTGDGDEAFGVAVDASGVYVTGRTGGAMAPPAQGGTDVFVRKYDASGNVVWTRQLGTTGADYGNAVAVDASGVYVAGETTGTFPGQTKAGGLFDAFVAKFDLAGAPQWMREFGTNFEDAAFGVTVNAAGVSVVGFVEEALPGQAHLGAPDFFLRRYDANGADTGTLQFGSPGTNKAYGVASDGLAVYVAGYSATPAEGNDAYLAKFPNPPNVSPGGVVNNGSFAPSPAPLAPGSIAAVFGTNLNDGSVVLASSFGPDGKLVTTLGGSSTTINNIPAPAFYSTTGQLGVQIPFELAGQTSATIRVTVNGQTSVPRTFAIDALAPGIFTTTSDGRGTAAVLHQDGVNPVTAQNPTKPNEIVVFFATGLGVLSPPLGTGEPSVGNRTATPTVTVDGASAEILFSGAAPGFVGLNQINLRIPPNTRTAANIPVVLTIGGKQSNAVTIPVAP
jgi:uncharacterized protein (TIGR03437 family)